MDSNINTFFKSIETENTILTEKVASLETENFGLNQQLVQLQKALDKQTKFHRKFTEDVEVTEKIRTQDFKEEKRSLTEQNKLLTKENRQLSKDCSFYKNAFEELAKDSESTTNSEPNRASSQSPIIAKSTSSGSAQVSSQFHSSMCTHKSSKVLSKISEKLLLENKKLKLKLESLNEVVRGLKAKNKQLDDFKKKIDNKKMQFGQDSDKLAKMIDSTKTKNKITFNPKVLAKLGELSEYKIEM